MGLAAFAPESGTPHLQTLRIGRTNVLGGDHPAWGQRAGRNRLDFDFVGGSGLKENGERGMTATSSTEAGKSLVGGDRRGVGAAIVGCAIFWALVIYFVA
jgi:hypothetical protein